MEEVYSRTWYIGEGEGLRKCKGGCGGVQKKNECGSKKTREVGYSGRKRLQEGGISREIHGKDVVWVGW